MDDKMDEYVGPERRVCTHHSGVDTKLTIFNWLLGLLIAAILGSSATLAGILQGVNRGMADINVKFAELRSDKALNDATHQRIYERIADLERRDREKRP